MDLGIEAGRIGELKKGFALLDCNILPRWSGDERCDETYDTLSRYCILRGVVPPRMDVGLVRKLAVLFPVQEEEVKERMRETPERRAEIREEYSLEYNLEKRCKKLPKVIESMEYFIRALGGEGKKTEYEPMSLYILD